MGKKIPAIGKSEATGGVYRIEKRQGLFYSLSGKATMGGQNEQENKFTQTLFTGLEAEKAEEIVFDNCLVLSHPAYRETEKVKEWVCDIHAQPSLFQPETDMELIASATN